MANTLRKPNAFDLSSLMRQSDSLECLDGLRQAIHGDPLSLMGMASTLFAQSHSGAVLEQDGKMRAIARMIHWQEEDFAQLQFISAEDPANTNLNAIIEALLKDVGEWGLTRVMGDMPVNSPYLSAFRKSNFILWASYKAYTFPLQDLGTAKESQWRTWTSQDFDGMKSVYQTLVASRVRNYEPMTRSKVLGKVLADEKGKILAYVDLDMGTKGLWAQVFMLFEACKTEVLEDLLRQLFAEYGRPVTISARSYQAWLRTPLEELGGQAWEERALLVKHLALRSPSPETVEEALFDNAKAKSGAFSMKTQK